MKGSEHSFGGRSMDRYVLDFETTETGGEAPVADSYEAVVAAADGAEGGADSTVVPAAAEEVVAAATEEPSAVDETASPWAPSQEEFQALTERQAEIYEYLRARETPAPAATPAATAAPELPNPLDPDYETQMAAYLTHQLDERDRIWQERFDGIAPTVQSVQRQEQLAQKEAMIDAIAVDGFEKDKPEFRQGAEFFAVGLIDGVKAELGLPLDQPSARAAEVALKRGAEQFTAFATAQREAGKAAYLAEMEALKTAGQTADLGVSGGGTASIEPTEDYDTAWARMTAPAASNV